MGLVASAIAGSLVGATVFALYVCVIAVNSGRWRR